MKRVGTVLVFVLLLQMVNDGPQTYDTEPISAARHGFAEPASVIPKGIIQFEGGYIFSRNSDIKDHTFGDCLIRFGLMKKIQQLYPLLTSVSCRINLWWKN